jgi:hypothetical protein
VVRKDLVALAGGVVIFAECVIWLMPSDKSAFFTIANIHDLFDILGALATLIAAGVAVVALTNWRSQFSHEARFQSLKDLKDAATELHTFRRYLIVVEARCVHLMHSGGVGDESLHRLEEEAKQAWMNSLQRYNKAWGTAVPFFTAAEEAAFTGPAPVYVKRSLEDPMRIVMAFANAPDAENINQFAETCRAITEEVRGLYASTVSELELMLRQNYRS